LARPQLTDVEGQDYGLPKLGHCIVNRGGSGQAGRVCPGYGQRASGAQYLEQQWV
jgi:hypothetical protein